MDKITIFVGMDIPKDSIDVYDTIGGHFQFENSTKGFSLFKKRLFFNHWCVMEATGCYHQRLAVGKKTAMILIVSTNGFRDFESASQVSSFFGLAPNERSSGSSVRGRTRISKVGDPLLRNHLFLCSFTACVHNPQCKALFERIVLKGKGKELALIAVCNKLIKQAYGIARSGLDYDRNSVGRLS